MATFIKCPECGNEIRIKKGEFKQTSSKFHEILKAEFFKNRSCFRVPRLSEIPYVGIKFDINLNLRLVL